MQTKQMPTTRLVSMLPILVILPVVAFLVSRQANQGYTIRKLRAPDCLESPATALNDAVQVVGWCTTTQVPQQALVWHNGSATKLATLGGVCSHASAINQAGQIVGAADTQGGSAHACLWQGEQTRDLGTLGGSQSEALAINQRRQVVGWSKTWKAKHHAFLWENNQMQDLGTLGGESSEALAINQRGQVVGWACLPNKYHHAVLWENGKVHDLGTLGGAQSEARAINAAGVIVGQADTGGVSRHAFRYDNGVMADIDSRKEPAADSCASGINREGQIVVFCSGPGVESSRGEDAAFCLKDGHMKILHDYQPKSTGYGLGNVLAINDRGVIVAYGITTSIAGNRQRCALLLTPR